MTVYLATNRPSSFDNSNKLTVSTSTTYLDSNSGLSGQMVIGSNGGIASKFLDVPLQEGWFRIRMNGATSGNYATGSLMFMYDTSGNTLFALRSNNGDVHVRRYTTPSAFIEGDNVPLSTGPHYFDYNFKIATTGGFMRFYLDNVLAYAYEGDTSKYAGAPLGEIKFTDYFALGDVTLGNFIIADEDTRGMLIRNIEPEAAGDLSQQTGAYTDVVNASSRNDSTGLTSDVADQITTFQLKDTPAGNPIQKGVFINARAVRGATGPQKTNLLLRTGGSNFHGPDVDPGVAAKMVTRGWGLNPNTGLAWTTAEVNALQAGVRSRA